MVSADAPVEPQDGHSILHGGASIGGEAELAGDPAVLPSTNQDALRAALAGQAGASAQGPRGGAGEGVSPATGPAEPSNKLPHAGLSTAVSAANRSGEIHDHGHSQGPASSRQIARAQPIHSYPEIAPSPAPTSQGILGYAGGLFSAIGRGICSFASGLAESFGLDRMAKGVHDIVSAGCRLVGTGVSAVFGRGSLSEFSTSLWGGLSGIGQCLYGTLLFAGEISGVNDLCRATTGFWGAASAFLAGHYGRAWSFLGHAGVSALFAALSLPMAITAIAAAIPTGGASLLALTPLVFARQCFKQGVASVTKVAVKEFFEKGAGEIAQSVVKGMGREALDLVEKRIGGSVLSEVREQAARKLGVGASQEAITEIAEGLAMQRLLNHEGMQIALESGEALSKRLTVVGDSILNASAVRSTVSEASQERLWKLLNDLKVKDLVDDFTGRLLLDINRKDIGRAISDFAGRLGVSPKEAEGILKKIRKTLANEAADAEIKAVLEEGITKHIGSVLSDGMHNSFKETFERGLKGEIRDEWSQALKQGIGGKAANVAKTAGRNADDVARELTDEFVEAGCKGLGERVSTITRLVVREGIEEAFTRFRGAGKGNRRPHRPHSNNNRTGDAVGNQQGNSGEGFRAEEQVGIVGDVGRGVLGERYGSKVEIITGPSGTVEVTYVWDPVQEAWQKTSQVEFNKQMGGAGADLEAGKGAPALASHSGRFDVTYNQEPALAAFFQPIDVTSNSRAVSEALPQTIRDVAESATPANVDGKK